MQSATAVLTATITEKKQSRSFKASNHNESSGRGFVGLCDWSAKETTNSKEMQEYKQYLRKLCILTDEVLGRKNRELE